MAKKHKDSSQLGLHGLGDDDARTPLVDALPPRQQLPPDELRAKAKRWIVRVLTRERTAPSSLLQRWLNEIRAKLEPGLGNDDAVRLWIELCKELDLRYREVDGHWRISLPPQGRKR